MLASGPALEVAFGFSERPDWRTAAAVPARLLAGLGDLADLIVEVFFAEDGTLRELPLFSSTKFVKAA